MKRKKIVTGIVSMAAAFTLAACASDETDTSQNEYTDTNESSSESMDGMDHSNMDMSGSGEVPEGLKVADNPTYVVGSQAIIELDHMAGMKGAEATIVGAYDTTVYTVSYTPTNGGEPVKNHKWVIHEELSNVGEAPLEPGTEVTINADHMEGMNGAIATIATAEETTVYMLDYTSTTGEKVTNHKWVTESELSPVK